MTTPHKQLRELRNKILGEPKLEYRGRFKIPNKPVSINDLLLMLQNNGDGELYGITDGGVFMTENELLDIQLDLTKDVEKQDDKVIKDIIKLLTHK